MLEMNYSLLDSQQIAVPFGCCKSCGGDIYHGEEVFLFEDEIFDDVSCATDYMLKHRLIESATAGE